MPRLNVADALGRPTSRTLLTYLAQNEAPVPPRMVREALSLSIAQLGLATRDLERHNLVVRRSLPSEAGNASWQAFLEATDLGREHARRLVDPA